MPTGFNSNQEQNTNTHIELSLSVHIGFRHSFTASVLWGASVTEKERAQRQIARARISNRVFGGQCHLTHLTILRSRGPVSPMCAHRWPKTILIH